MVPLGTTDPSQNGPKVCPLGRWVWGGLGRGGEQAWLLVGLLPLSGVTPGQSQCLSDLPTPFR